MPAKRLPGGRPVGIYGRHTASQKQEQKNIVQCNQNNPFPFSNMRHRSTYERGDAAPCAERRKDAVASAVHLYCLGLYLRATNTWALAIIHCMNNRVGLTEEGSG